MNNKMIKRLILYFMICISCLSSCKSNPESSVVVKHSTSEFIEALIIDEENIEERNIPNNYYNEFTSKDNKVKIIIDAKISVPEEKRMPVIKVELAPITQEKLNWAVENFMENNEGTYPSMEMSKTEIEAWILTYKSKLADEEQLYKESSSNEEVEELKSYLQTWIKKYQAMYKDAPDESIQIPTGLVFRPFSFYSENNSDEKKNELELSDKQLLERENSRSKNLYMISDALLSDGRYARLSVYNEYAYSVDNYNSVFHVEQHQIHIVYSYIPLTIDTMFVLNYAPFTYWLPTFGSLDSKYPNINISKDEAILRVKEKLESIGLNDFYVDLIKDVEGLEYLNEYKNYYYNDDNNDNNVLSKDEYFSEENINKFYLITMRPIYYGIPLLEAQQAFSSEVLYNMPIESEKIVIRVSQDDIAEFKWTNPIDISGVINDNVKIITFDVAIENAIKFMKTKYMLPTVAPIIPEMDEYEKILNEYIDACINISEIKLGLGTIPAPNSNDEYLIIPVWNLYGSYSLTSTYKEYSFGDTELDYPLVSINAVDGSIISQNIRLTH